MEVRFILWSPVTLFNLGILQLLRHMEESFGLTGDIHQELKLPIWMDLKELYNRQVILGGSKDFDYRKRFIRQY